MAFLIAPSKSLAEVLVSGADLLVVGDAKVHSDGRIIGDVVPLSCGAPAPRKFTYSNDFGEPTYFPHSATFHREFVAYQPCGDSGSRLNPSALAHAA